MAEQQQWTIGTTVFHTIVGTTETLEAKKAEILNAINDGITSGVDGVTDVHDNLVIPNVVCVEYYVGDSVVECTTDITSEETTSI
jgi:hypothetical protein